jgi:hypothetical protein
MYSKRVTQKWYYFYTVKNEKPDKAEEPSVAYGSKRLTFFNSFDEAEEHSLKEMKGHTFEQRLANLEILRKRYFNSLLLPNGNWPPLKRIITVIKGTPFQ